MKLLPRITQSSNSDFLLKNPAYIFHHLIKSGGNSILSVIQKWFKMEIDREETYGDKSRFIKYKINHLNIFSDTCITSHFQYEGAFLHQRYPELIDKKEEIKIFIFIRDPLNFRISHYYYTLKDENNSDFTLEQILSCGENWISGLIPCNEFNYKEVMDKYFFIGITEKMQESFDLLADLAGKKRIKLPFANVSEKDDQVFELSKEFIDEFKKRNKLDYMIYEYCLKKFNKLLSESNLQK